MLSEFDWQLMVDCHWVEMNERERIMRFLFLTVCLILSACASGPDSRRIDMQREEIAKIEKVELFYNEPDEWVVMDGGGSGMTGMAGILGPIGVLLAAGADAASKAGIADRAERRSKEFNAAIASSVGQKNLSSQFAMSVAELIRKSGREVKLTATKRAKGAVGKMALDGIQPTPGYVPVILRLTLGYGAETATSSFTPFIVVEHKVQSVAQEPLVHGTQNVRGKEPSYFTYQGLLDNHVVAHDGLKRELLGQLPQSTFKAMFLVP